MRGGLEIVSQSMEYLQVGNLARRWTGPILEHPNRVNPGLAGMNIRKEVVNNKVGSQIEDSCLG
jgi:hypothetical protein